MNMRLFHFYKSNNDLLNHFQKKLTMKITVLMFVVAALFFCPGGLFRGGIGWKNG